MQKIGKILPQKNLLLTAKCKKQGNILPSFKKFDVKHKKQRKILPKKSDVNRKMQKIGTQNANNRKNSTEIQKI